MTPPTDEFEQLRMLREACDKIVYETIAFTPLAVFAHAAHAALGPEGCLTKELERLRRFETAGEGVTDLELVVHERDALLEEVKRLRNLWTPDLDQRWQALVADHETERRRRQAAEAECEDLQKQLDVEVTVGARLVDANEDLASENKLLRQDLQDARDLIPPDVGTSDSSVYGKLSAARSENKLLLASREQLGAENKALLQRVKDAEKENAVLMARLAKVSAAAEAYIDEDTIEKMMALRAVLNETPPPYESKSTSTLSPCPRCGETVPTTFKDGLLTYRCMRCAESA